jgi:hypothetical protein
MSCGPIRRKEWSSRDATESVGASLGDLGESRSRCAAARRAPPCLALERCHGGSGSSPLLGDPRSSRAFGERYSIAKSKEPEILVSSIPVRSKVPHALPFAISWSWMVPDSRLNTRSIALPSDFIRRSSADANPAFP